VKCKTFPHKLGKMVPFKMFITFVFCLAQYCIDIMQIILFLLCNLLYRFRGYLGLYVLKCRIVHSRPTFRVTNSVISFLIRKGILLERIVLPNPERLFRLFLGQESSSYSDFECLRRHRPSLSDAERTSRASPLIINSSISDEWKKQEFGN
jgi:hypothetical protein